MGERSLHAALKVWCAQPGDRLEVAVDGYVIDIVRGDLLIEIQTRSFSPIRRKLADLLQRHRVRLVYPVAREKWIVRLCADGLSQMDRRKSAEHLGLVHVFVELVHIADLMSNPNMELEVVVIQEEEVRRHVPRTGRRRRSVPFDRRLLTVEGHRIYRSAADLKAFIPDHLAQPFTNADLADAMGEPVWLAEKVTYCLRKMNALQVVGKRGWALLHTT